MSVLELPGLEAVLDAVPDAVRAAAAEAHARTERDRRVHERLTGAQLEFIRQVRLKNGPALAVVDLSCGGLLVESRFQLKPGTRVTLEISGRGPALERSSEVLRCQLAALRHGAATYRGACMFVEPLTLDSLRLGALELPEAPATAADLPGTAWQKIVVRYRDGAMLKGYTLDFHPSREHFSLWPSVNATATERVVVPLARLKALFFVKDFAGNPHYEGPVQPAPEVSAGRRVEVTFLDREVVRGTTLSFSPDGAGFFVTPADASGNNQRVFVVNGAVRHVRFP
jgi:hypothetical protein